MSSMTNLILRMDLNCRQAEQIPFLKDFRLLLLEGKAFIVGCYGCSLQLQTIYRLPRLCIPQERSENLLPKLTTIF